MIRINVSRADATLTETETLTEGRVGLRCAFTFGEEWNGLQKIAYFQGADEKSVAMVDGDEVEVPWECMASAGYKLNVGVRGDNASGDTVIPTVWVRAGKIVPSPDSSIPEGEEPTPSVVAQIQQAAANALLISKNVAEQAESGAFKGDKGDTGEQGPQGDTGDPGVYIGTTPPTDPDVTVWIDPNGPSYTPGAIDEGLSSTSENPVQNKVVTAALATKADQASVESTIPPIVNTWLGDNIAQETGYALDASLTMSNAAAPADKVGDIVKTDDTIVWNQLASVFTRASGTLFGGVTYTKSADGSSITLNGTASAADFYQIIQSGLGTSVAGHKYIFYVPKISGEIDGRFWFYLYNRSDARDFGDGVIWTAPSAANLVVGIENSQTDLPVTFTNAVFRVPVITDLTLAFGAGNEPTIEEFKAMFPLVNYPRDTGTTRPLTRIEEMSKAIYELRNSSLGKKNVKLSILTFNCGHYNYGSGNEGDWTGSELTEKINLWKAMLGKYKPDIMLGTEMSQYFDSARTVNAITTIFTPLMPYTYFYSWGRVISKFEIVQSWNEDISVTINGTTYQRSCGVSILNVSGIHVLACATHLPAGYSANDTIVRNAMRDKLITFLSGYEYVILGGDFNESTDSFFAPFTDAGFTLANHGYFGAINTFPNESIDNIIVKGFTLYNAVSGPSDSCTSDHYPFSSDILMN